MAAQIIDGKALSKQLRVGFRERVQHLKARGVSPGLAVILVGDNPASRVYVGNKVKACEECGVRSLHIALAADVSEAVVLATIERLNRDAGIHGILVQLPLPAHIPIARVLEAISVHKDVDGFHLYNVGALVTGTSIFPPCTPYGVQLLLDTTGIDVAGKNAVVVGASNIVGKPMGLMLLQREATVTICHAKTRDLAQHTILADILIVAAGKPGLIVPQMVKEGAIVIDVGINRLPDGRIVGDVCFDAVKEKASWITPVPGGVGPMTVTMLIENTLRSAERAFKAAGEDEFQEWEAPTVKSPA
ncbi:MAG: bifunctional methylenetetrahydrofolate dehydrogenase/methenyltetrahydrofolate cyclohydrolase FolD [Hydrogenophaga sp.]|uniref:bifunctional methylenetetrahydrofolate dehydrogenase/methenyltetrahydrofolate cyclohydrolase FolD n=1 Tax=Hydrogenophaga sp. TaxID=1904254 RepID=UPI002725E342|nr:bifunctional methylenetetrahydrofolate dehydrogenase/methenyltetrahydrofolate cyclohydrolase FolD [Hydrogenophaga sp.]MDO9480420.1 bifunctional methylenetetrahydrofolate dehydrogenase/methenyltetrahydrofolate cyclohydrolase FolD [Hydrogenophaga sp.]MDP3346519.1 bifunctional methylenetetrahydrofolate dehydrogenase/methenyltetrahydrofolate cyclohydrolase FolD [Hydrogenophaga sp.]MDP3807694.1 bifunctional methylenetetrahydrofolate dehydrogenase/methenyltetrahydrofolate cyclohydrolase FolD [Hydro